MKKSYNSIRLVRVGKAGETQFERGSIEDTVRRISRGDNLKLDSLGQTLLSVLHTDLPPLPTKPVRRLSSKIHPLQLLLQLLPSASLRSWPCLTRAPLVRTRNLMNL